MHQNMPVGQAFLLPPGILQFVTRHFDSLIRKGLYVQEFFSFSCLQGKMPWQESFAGATVLVLLGFCTVI